MSSQLTNLVPVLDNTNYQQWSTAMQSFLMSQGQWKCTKPGAIAPVVTTAEAETEAEGEPSTSVTATTGKEDLASWNEDAEKALGNIRLRLHHTIGYQFNEVATPAFLWQALKNRYGSQGLSRAFIEFKGLMDTVISGWVDLSPAINKIMSYYVCLNKMDWDIPKKIVGMMMIAKAPSSMESIVQLYSTILVNSSSKEQEEKLDPERIALAMRSSWEAHGCAGALWFNQQQANKLSVVKPAGNQPPQLQPQQQQRDRWGLGGGNKRGHRGKRDRQKNAQQQFQKAMVQQPEPNQKAGPSQPPPHQWVPAPTPPSYTSGPANMGYFAAQM